MRNPGLREPRALPPAAATLRAASRSMRSRTPLRDTMTWSGFTSRSFRPGAISRSTNTAMSRPLPVEKIAEAMGPPSGATTPFRRSPEDEATVADEGGDAPKSFAIAAMSTPASPAGEVATCAGATNTQVQCASWNASTSVSATIANVPIAPLACAPFLANAAMDEILLGLARQIDVDVAPRLVAERMLAVVEQPGMHEDRAHLVSLHHPRHVDADELHHLRV